MRRVPLGSLHADPANARTHDARNLRAITDSLAEFRQVEPLVVQAGTGRVIGGNGRLAAMRAAGWAEADVVEIDCDNTRAAALGIALNRTAELAGWDQPALAATLRALQSELDGDRLLTAAGYDPAELDGLLERMAAEMAAGTTEPRPAEPDGDPDPAPAGPTIAATVSPEAARLTLAERFGVPPFSVLDARQGYWQDRKRAWIALGIRSELGRGGGRE